ncbi:MAG: hypothetical protein JWP13_834 [Candidatus Saccharibacteria bacterium]|nr:hypothetical protein [Candidatus Saccharibacteria bacterium]
MKKSLYICLVLLATVSLSFVVLTSSALADEGKIKLKQDAACVDTPDEPRCVEKQPDPALNEDCRTDASQCNPVAQYINPLINTLSAAAGIAVVIGIIIGGIQYASSGGDPQKAAAGKNHIKMSVIALIGFFFLYAFLQFLIPGGILAE